MLLAVADQMRLITKKQNSHLPVLAERARVRSLDSRPTLTASQNNKVYPGRIKCIKGGQVRAACAIRLRFSCKAAQNDRVNVLFHVMCGVHGGPTRLKGATW